MLLPQASSFKLGSQSVSKIYYGSALLFPSTIVYTPQSITPPIVYRGVQVATTALSPATSYSFSTNESAFFTFSSSSASSSLPVTASILSGHGATLTQYVNTYRLSSYKEGLVLVQLTQPGNATYAVATPVNISFNFYAAPKNVWNDPSP